MVRSNVIYLSALLVVLGQSGCEKKPIEPPPPVEVTSAPPVEQAIQDLTHTISISGETLGLIAKWYTGDPANWVKIRDANPGTIPERLRIGSQLTIPGALVVKREPLTAEFVKSEFAAWSRMLANPTAQTNALKPQTTPADQGSPTSATPSSENKPPQLTAEELDKQEDHDLERLKAFKAEKADLTIQATKPVDTVGAERSTSEQSLPSTSSTQNPDPQKPAPQKPAPQKPDEVLFKEEGQNEDRTKGNITPPPTSNSPQAVAPNPSNEEDEERQKLLKELLGGK